MRKIILRRITLCVFVFLILCTFVSYQVQKLVLPQVTVSEAVPGVVNTDGNAVSYDYTIPYSALKMEGETYYAYYIWETDGKFGKEQTVMKTGVNVIARDGISAALKSKGYGGFVIRSDKPLEDGMRVMVKSKGD